MFFKQKGGTAIHPFFQESPHVKYGGRQGRNPLPYTRKSPQFRERDPGRGVSHTTTSGARDTVRCIENMMVIPFAG